MTAGNSSITNPKPIPYEFYGFFVDEVQTFLSASISTSTQLTYSQGSTAFFQFRDSYHLPHTNPPLDHLINFIAYMSASNIAPSTIKTYMSIIAFNLKHY